MGKQAFLIGAYKNPSYLRKLIESVRCKDTNIYVHINKRNQREFHDLIHEYAEIPNVNIYSVVSIRWGGLRLLESMKFLIEMALSNNENCYFHFITGQDILVRPLEELLSFCNDNIEKNYIECKPYTNDWNWRYDFYHIYDYVNYIGSPFGRFLENASFKLQKILGFKRKQLGFKDLYLGSGWWSLTRDAVLEISNQLSNIALMKRLSFTFAPDEIVFQNILANSSHKESIQNHNLCYIKWDGKGHPLTLSELDIEDIRKSGMFFARKIDPVISKKLIEIIDNNNNRK